MDKKEIEKRLLIFISEIDIEDIKNDLRANFEGECSEVGMYLAMARVAHREGYPEVAFIYRKITEVEKRHEARYKKLAQNIQEGTVFKKDEGTLWKCINCGYIYEGAEAPEACPACAHPQGYFEVFVENY